MTTLAQLLRRAVQQGEREDEDKATIGWKQSSGEYLFDVPGEPAQVYITLRVNAQDTTHDSVLFRGGLRQGGYPVIIQIDNKGRRYIEGPDEEQARQFSSQSTASAYVAQHGVSHHAVGGDPIAIDSLQILNGLIITVSGTTVQLGRVDADGTTHDTIFYVDGLPHVIPAGTTYNWASDAAGITAGMQALIAIMGDPATDDLTVVLSDEVSASAPSIDVPALVASLVTSGYAPLLAIRVRSGQTTAPAYADMYDLRPFAGSIPGSAPTIADFTNATHTHQNNAGGGKLNMRAMSAIACRVYNSGAIVVADATDVALTFDSERRDDGGLHSTASNTSRINITVTGWWSFGCNIQFEGNATGVRTLWSLLDATTILASTRQTVVGASDERMEVNGLYYFTSGSYIEFYVRQNSTVSLNIEVSANHSPEAWAIFLGT